MYANAVVGQGNGRERELVVAELTDEVEKRGDEVSESLSRLHERTPFGPV